MKLSEMYPSKYLSVDDFDDEMPVIIANLSFEKMKADGGKEEQKPVLHFLKVDKAMVLNKTNAKRIAEIHGDDTDTWPGKRLTLIKEWVDAFGESTWAIRVKMVPKGKPPFEQSAPAPAETVP